jgi:hypothetical protein
MSNLHRGHSIDASCHVSVNLASLLLYTYLKPKNEFGQNPEDLGDGFIKAIIACF